MGRTVDDWMVALEAEARRAPLSHLSPTRWRWRGCPTASNRPSTRVPTGRAAVRRSATSSSRESGGARRLAGTASTRRRLLRPSGTTSRPVTKAGRLMSRRRRRRPEEALAPTPDRDGEDRSGGGGQRARRARTAAMTSRAKRRRVDRPWSSSNWTTNDSTPGLPPPLGTGPPPRWACRPRARTCPPNRWIGVVHRFVAVGPAVGQADGMVHLQPRRAGQRDARSSSRSAA